MDDATRLLKDWYLAVQNEDAACKKWARLVMSDQENGIVSSRLANCAAKSVEMFVELARLDGQLETEEMVRSAMEGVLAAKPR
ncbi:hypothetical protein KBW81_12910 [Loktanella salsilacus]|uniref:hypothetical protein n=1 Tax=Loktanella salsilacus TaxID=195913 RepID=UPI0020B68758|nr:hypothetical protein [Loktanella salsilacus]UTH47605.1 hypothetical protein KBW81_12910 [Loktanella salsilacus]